MEAKMDAKTWWYKEGAKKLDNIIINLVGEKIGYVPLENLLDDIPYDFQEIEKEMTNDGCTIKVEKYKDGEECYFIYIK